MKDLYEEDVKTVLKDHQERIGKFKKYVSQIWEKF